MMCQKVGWLASALAELAGRKIAKGQSVDDGEPAWLGQRCVGVGPMCLNHG